MNKKSLLHAVLDGLEEGICLIDACGRVCQANAAALDLLGWEEGDLLGRDAASALASGGLAPGLADALGKGEACQGQAVQLSARDGAAVMVDYTLSLVRADPPLALLRLRKAAPTVCDVALQDSESKLGAILDTITDGVVAIDENGTVKLFNTAAEALFGYRAGEVLGRNVSLLMPPPDHAAHDSYIAHYLRTGVKKIIGKGREVIGKRKDGTLFPFYLTLGEAPLSGQRLFVGILRDLTASKQAEEKLLTLSRVVEQSPNAVMIANLEGVVEYVNSSFTRLTGYESEEAVGQKLTEVRSAYAPPAAYERLRQTLLAGGEWREEIQDRKKSGRLYWALETVSPMRNGTGSITHFLLIQQNISEQKRAQEALRTSEERFRQVAEMSGEWLWEQDPDGCYLYSSGAVRQILGYAPEEILGNSYLNLLTEEDKRHWMSALPPTQEVHEPFFRLVNRYRHKDGHEVFTESTGEPLFDERGRLVKWRGVDHDITSRKRYEDALRLRDRAIEAASVGINIADARRRDNPNIYVNPALSRITGYSRDELLGRNMRLLQGPDTDPAVVAEISRALREGRSCEVVLKNYRKEGTPFWNELLIAPVRDQSSRLSHFIGVHTDVTERRRAEEERHELQMARQIQLSLLPKAPLRGEGFEAAGICLPATHVGGDYFDYFYSHGLLNMVIADVSGHSMGAALLMAGVRSTLKAQAHATDARSGLGTAAMLAALNELLYDDLNGSDLFISLFFLRYDPATRRLCYANAGHNLPLLSGGGGPHCGELDAEGLLLGISKNAEFEERCLQLQAGDRVLLYTDGITEAQDPVGEFFGVGRLCEVFFAQRGETPQATIAQILAALHVFSGSQSFNDDVSMAVLKVG